MSRWLLEQLQHFVGASLVHALGKPYYAHLILAHARLQAQCAYQLVALRTGDYGLLTCRAYGVHPLFYGEVRSFGEHFAPFLGEVAAHGLVLLTHGRQFYGGVGEVQVRVVEVVCECRLAEHVRRESHGDSHLAASRRPAQQ